MVSFYGLSDDELLCYMREGSRAAYTEIYNRYWKKLYTDTHRRISRPDLVEEIVQDVFTDLWASRERRQINHLGKYLSVAMRFSVYVNYRRSSREKDFLIFEEPLEHLLLSDLEADSWLHAKDLNNSINLWLSMQPTKRAEIFRLKYIEDFSTKEISTMLGITQKTVQNQLITAFTSLRDFMKKSMGILMFIKPF